MASRAPDVVTLSIGHEDFPGRDAERVVVIAVNGADLRQVLGSDDSAFVPVSAASSLDYWLGRTTSRAWTHGGRTAILTCGCMDFGCGGIAARISASRDEVVWSDISHPFVQTGSLGTFRFDRQQYEGAVESMLQESRHRS
jgi:2-polyprenyl-3-methyl-5-hydroxy-6-metoxy-1,4-benzoquinol methylase